MRQLLLVALVALLLVPGTLRTSAQTSEMTNADVVKMVKAGLSDDVVSAAIRGAKARKFTTSADGLIELKNSGVSDRVIAAMLDPNAGAAAPAAAPAPTQTVAGVVNTALPVAEISLVTKDGATHTIKPEGGDISQTYAFVRMVSWANFRGLKSDVRITDRRPSIVVKTDETKFDTRFMVVKTEDDEDDKLRSVRLKSGVYSTTTAFVPEEDWVLKTKDTQEGGVWRMTLEKDLGKGEFGIIDTQNRYLYGFGVD